MPADGFVWDERSAQPQQTGGRTANFLRGAGDLIPMLAMAGCSAIHLPGILTRYRQFQRETPSLTLTASCMGLAVSYQAEMADRLQSDWKASGARTLLVRVHSWEEARYEEIRDFVAGFGCPREDVIIAVIQDRAGVADLDLWERRLTRIIDLFRPAAAGFQIGHVPNRKKWGFRNHGEFASLCRRSLPLRADDIRFIGPSTIDFELMYLDAILSSVPRGTFDVINSLLYVDRRGMPEKSQGFNFDLGNKIRITKALADYTGHGDRPFWITEVNWPLEGTGKYAPAGRGVRVSESVYADYLARYYLLAFATGIPERIVWWELGAHGYGLIDTRETYRIRDGYLAFQTLCRLLPGRTNREIFERRGLYLTSFTDASTTLFAVWHADAAVRLGLKDKPIALCDRLGRSADPADGAVTAEPAPLYLQFEGARSIGDTFEIQA